MRRGCRLKETDMDRNFVYDYTMKNFVESGTCAGKLVAWNSFYYFNKFLNFRAGKIKLEMCRCMDIMFLGNNLLATFVIYRQKVFELIIFLIRIYVSY